jgi:hypothetical protein
MRLVSIIGLFILLQSCKSNDDWIVAIPGRGLYINGDSILIYRTSISDLEKELGIKRDTATFPDIRISDGFSKKTGEQYSESKFVTNLTYKSIDFEFSGDKEDSMKLEWIRIKDTNDIKVRVNDKLILGMVSPDILTSFSPKPDNDYVSEDMLTYNFYSYGISFGLEKNNDDKILKEVSVHYVLK